MLRGSVTIGNTPNKSMTQRLAKKRFNFFMCASMVSRIHWCSPQLASSSFESSKLTRSFITTPLELNSKSQNNYCTILFVLLLLHFFWPRSPSSVCQCSLRAHQHCVSFFFKSSLPRTFFKFKLAASNSHNGELYFCQRIYLDCAEPSQDYHKLYTSLHILRYTLLSVHLFCLFGLCIHTR